MHYSKRGDNLVKHEAGNSIESSAVMISIHSVLVCIEGHCAGTFPGLLAIDHVKNK